MALTEAQADLRRAHVNGGAVFLGLGAAFIACGAAGLAAPQSVALPMTIGLSLAELALGALLVRQWRKPGEAA